MVLQVILPVFVVTLFMVTILVAAMYRMRKPPISDDRAAMRKLASDVKERIRLMDMSVSQRLDAQRQFIADTRAPHIVEIIANLNPYGVSKYTIKGVTNQLASQATYDFKKHLKDALEQILPLGGAIVSLPHSRSGGVTLHALVSLETKYKADAHEIAEHVCADILRANKHELAATYSRVAFLPVDGDALRGKYVSLFPAGRKPGLWVSTDYGEVLRAYTRVVRRDSRTAVEPSTAAGTEWEDARTLLRTVTDEFAAFEFSPMDVAFTRRLLWDLTEPATAKFYEAFDAANMLLTDKPPADPSGFVEAVRVADAAWKSADRNARDKAEQGISGGNQVLDADRIRHRDTAKAAMTLALDPATTDSEAGIAWSRSMDALSKAGLTVPPSKIRKLEGNELVQRATRALTR